MEQYIIVVAGGRGTRMGGDTPKQFLPLAGSTVLMQTLDCMAVAMPDATLIVALPCDLHAEWRSLCRKYNYTRRHIVTEGGESRFHTVKNALAVVPDHALVGIHDGVRPLVSASVVQQAFATAQSMGCAIPVMPITESIRCVDENASYAVDRSRYKSVQTPQVFDSTLLKQAYDNAYRPDFTDDASVFEAAGNKIVLIEGNRDNIKITFPRDIFLAEFILSHP